MDMPVTGEHIGAPVIRVDARLKVTGQADYAAERAIPDLAHGVVVGAAIGAGKITRIDIKPALALPGVLDVITHENRGTLHRAKGSMLLGQVDDSRGALAGERVTFCGQPVAFVVAETFEEAMHAATQVVVEYEEAPPVLTAETATSKYEPGRYLGEKMQYERGKVDAAMATAAVKIDATYETPSEHPTPMELHGTIAMWQNGELHVRNATQWVMGDRGVLARVFRMWPGKVHIHAPYLGGMFGSKATTGGHVILAALAAKRLDRPVKCVLSRPAVLQTVGHRPRTVQRFEVGAAADGTLVAMRHTTTTHTSQQDNYVEPTNLTSRHLYTVPAYASSLEVKRLNVVMPGWMRAPGEAPCQFAHECAIDELAVALAMDPIELRRKNDAERDLGRDLPYSSKHLMACFERGAARFGWDRRSAKPGTRRDGRVLVGYGTATATYPGNSFGAKVRARLERTDGRVRAVLDCMSSDVGTGLYTVVAAIAAETLKLPFADIEVKLGSTDHSYGPVAGGSGLTAAIGPAVYSACTKLASKRAKDELRDGDVVKASAFTAPVMGADRHHTFQSFGAVFAEVTVDPELGMVRVRRMTGVYDAGRIMNPRTARSQLLGGLTFGIGMALLEELIPDPAHGRFINADLAEYKVPVHADMPDLDVSFVEEPDLAFNSLGCRGVGEIGITGAPAAIANAVYNATGKRIRDLPVTVAKILDRRADPA
jgi:xanthine dehydrogenase YagR molybdenum-binding subunit